MENNKKWREEVKFIILITGIISSALFNWFSVKSEIALLKYRVDKVETARAEVWEQQNKINQEQAKTLNSIQLSLAGIMEVVKKR